MSDGKNYYVYAILDPTKNGIFKYGDLIFDNEPFYIGKGTKNRIYDTLYSKKSTFKVKKIEKLKKSGHTPIVIKIFENLYNTEALNREIETIKIIGRRDMGVGPLTNLTDGGDGRLTSPPSEETKKKISDSKKGQSHPVTEETKQKISIAQLGEKNHFFGKTHSVTVKQNQSERVIGDNHPMYNKHHSPETIEKFIEHRKTIDNEKIKKSCAIFKKIVLQYNKKMELLNTFESVQEAALKTKVHESVINKICRGEIFNPKKYYFRYKNEKDNIKTNSYLIGYEDTFYYNNIQHKIIKRNRVSATCLEVVSKNTVNISYDVFLPLTYKDTNDINFVDFIIFIKTLGNFTINKKTYTVENDNVIFYYYKLYYNSEIFINKNEIITSDKQIIILYEDEWINKKDNIKTKIINILKNK